MRRPSGRVFAAPCDRFSTRRQEDLKHRKESWAANLARKGALRKGRSPRRLDGVGQRSGADSAATGRVEDSGSGSEGEIGGRLAAFRAACDRFFERFKHRDQAELASKAEPRETVIRELEQLVSQDGSPDATPPDGLVTVIQQARAKWQQAPELPRQMQQDLAALPRGARTSGDHLACGIQRDRPGSRSHAAPDGKTGDESRRLASASGNHSARLTPANWRDSGVSDSRRTPRADAPKPTNHAGAQPNRTCEECAGTVDAAWSGAG